MFAFQNEYHLLDSGNKFNFQIRAINIIFFNQKSRIPTFLVLMDSVNLPPQIAKKEVVYVTYYPISKIHNRSIT